MKEYTILKNIAVIGTRVKSFPNGIEAAFMDLMKKLPGGDKRIYYGIGECTATGIVYIAAAEQKKEGEGRQYDLESYVIEKGNYLAVEILDWKPKTSSIKNVFEEMYKDERADRSKPSIEIYFDDKRMLCLVSVDESKGKKLNKSEIESSFRS